MQCELWFIEPRLVRLTNHYPLAHYQIAGGNLEHVHSTSKVAVIKLHVGSIAANHALRHLAA